MRGIDRDYAPVVVFAYNRRDKLERCLTSLDGCDGVSNTILYLLCDGAKPDSVDEVKEVRDYVESYAQTGGFAEIIVEKKDKNMGLAQSVIQGVTEVLRKHGKAIVVEDDLVVAPHFLVYMNEALKFYEGKKEYGSISAFTYPLKELKQYKEDVFVTRKAECWGWATWSDRWNDGLWKDTDFESYLTNNRLRRDFEALEAGLDRLMVLQYHNKISSWAVRWIYYLYCKGMYTVYPRKSLVINEGFDGSGTHGIGFTKDINDRDDTQEISSYRLMDMKPNRKLSDAYARFPRRFYPIYILERFMYLIKK